jgi:hypothetical protein
VEAEQEPRLQAPLGVERAAVPGQVSQGAFAGILPALEIHRDRDGRARRFSALIRRRGGSDGVGLSTEPVPARLALKGLNGEQRKEAIERACELALDDQQTVTPRAEHAPPIS